MDNTVLIGVVVLLVIAVVAICSYFLLQNRRTENLRSRFGPEYDHAVQDSGDRARAEANLEQRKRRVERLRIRPLSPPDAARYMEAWRKVQARFVDDPSGAITEADQLLGNVMATRGYPVTDFDQRAADISVDHPRVVENYRIGHDIALRHSQGKASTEDLRQAMIHYRTLFEDLVGESDRIGEDISHAA